MIGDLTSDNDVIDKLGDLVEKELSSMDKAIEEVRKSNYSCNEILHNFIIPKKKPGRSKNRGNVTTDENYGFRHKTRSQRENTRCMHRSDAV